MISHAIIAHPTIILISNVHFPKPFRQLNDVVFPMLTSARFWTAISRSSKVLREIEVAKDDPFEKDELVDKPYDDIN